MPFWALKNIYSGLFISQSWSNSIQKLLEVDFSTFSLQVRNHVENGWVLWLESQWLHGWFKLARINLASGLSIEEVEGFSELLDFVFSEAWSFYFLLGPCFWDWLSSHSFKQILINFYINYLIQLLLQIHFIYFSKHFSSISIIWVKNWVLKFSKNVSRPSSLIYVELIQ